MTVAANDNVAKPELTADRLKTCTKCGETKELVGFSKDKSRNDGLTVHCKSCCAAYYAANSEKNKARQAAYYESNREKIRTKQAAYEVANRDKIKTQRAVYYEAVPEITAERLKGLMEYECSGEFRWLIDHGNARAGDIVGTAKRRGYKQVTIAGRTYLLHRLVWLHTYGRWPSAEIDHIDCNRANNAILNLRECTRGQNSANKKAYNDLGLKGIRLTLSGKFRADITFNGRTTNLGTYPTKELAAAVFAKVANDTHGQFARVA